MTHRRRTKYLRLAFLIVFLACAGIWVFRIEATSQLNPSNAISEHQQLSGEGKAQLRDLLDKAQLSDLRWPSFANDQIELKELYDSTGDTLCWIEGNRPTAQAREIIQALKDADYKGLKADDYDGPRWDGRLAQMQQSRAMTESDLVKFDLALSVSTMRYVSDLHIGRVNPRLFHFGLDIDHKTFDLSEFLRMELIDSPDTGTALASLEPPFPVYRRTEAALKTYLDLAKRDDGGILPVPPKAVKPGASYDGVPQLMKLLTLLGDLPANTAVNVGNVYQGALVTALKHFQQRHGLDPNGTIDPPTLKELNTPLAHRVLQLQLTMERLRWVPHQFDQPPVVVNIPEFRLRADDEQYHWALSMKVVVGKAYGHQTPVFASQIRAVIFRPYWNVPYSIVRAELLPHLKKDASYFAKNSYEVVDRNEHVVADGVVSTEVEQQLRAGKLYVRQRPGPENALGLLKFDVPSSYDVYLHDTPAQQLFSRSRRDFSHGCIRLENPVALAKWLLRDKPEWTEDNIRTAMHGEKTMQVKLDKPVPVLIVYGTAVVMEDGEVRFFDDIYGQDVALAQSLTGDYPYGSGVPAGK